MVEGNVEYNREWITENAQSVLREYYEGITLRQLYYRLVARGMTNSINQYKRVITAMVKARWENVVDMESFIDRERSMYGSTAFGETDVDEEIESGKEQIKNWMEHYSLNRWSNQENYIEVWIEKKALQGVFESPCMRMSVGLAPCKGYPSITFLNDARKRFTKAQNEGKNVTILYFGDYDPSGEDIPRSVEANLSRMGCNINMEVKALNAEQIEEYSLIGVPPKQTDKRTATWDGHEAVELDAIEPKTLTQMCKDAIEEYFDHDKHAELKEREEEEKEQYQEALKEFVNNLSE